MKDKKINLGIVFTIFISYILIKLIDNYKYFLDIFKLLVSLLNPFIIAFILAYIFIPIVAFLESKLKIKRIYALIITYACLILVIASFIFFTVPILVNSLADIIDKLPIYSSKTQDFLIHLGNNLENVDPNTLKEIGDKAFSFMPKVSNLFIGYLGQIFATTFSISKFIVQFVLAFIICFYIILEKEIFFSFYKKVLYITFGKKYANFVLNFGHTLNNNIGKYFTGKMLDSFIVGILSSIGLYFIGSQYSLLFGILIVFMNMIPYFGPAISMALFSLIYLILVQQIEIAFIEPKIVGGQLGLNPFLTILAVTIGGGFFGIPGMILSAPFMGVLKIYLGNYIDYKYKSINK